METQLPLSFSLYQPGCLSFSCLVLSCLALSVSVSRPLFYLICVPVCLCLCPYPLFYLPACPSDSLFFACLSCLPVYRCIPVQPSSIYHSVCRGYRSLSFSASPLIVCLSVYRSPCLPFSRLSVGLRLSACLSIGVCVYCLCVCLVYRYPYLSSVDLSIYLPLSPPLSNRAPPLLHHLTTLRYFPVVRILSCRPAKLAIR